MGFPRIEKNMRRALLLIWRKQVMAMPRLHVTIPFHPLLNQIAQCLHFPEPVYQFLDEYKNNACVLVKTGRGPIPYVYVGGEADTIGESCEMAAQKAVRDLVKKFSVCVEDITFGKNLKLQRCGELYRLKRAELENSAKGQAATYMKEGASSVEKNSLLYVCVDYMSILRTIVPKIELRSTPIETVQYAPGQFVAWQTIMPPNRVNAHDCIFSDLCPDLVAAKQNLAKKVIAYLAPLYNIEIIDVNYGTTSSGYTSIMCGLERESYITARERIRGIKDQVEASFVLVEQDCITPRAPAYRTTPLPSIPLPPKKRKYSASTSVHSTTEMTDENKPEYFAVPDDLGDVFSCKFHEQR